MQQTSQDSVETIDCNYLGQEHAAAFLMVEGDRAAFVDVNTTKAAPLLLDALAARGLEPEQVKYIVITHVHLDHAGGTAAMLKLCTKAKVLCHPRAARHLANPVRLIQGARHIYGPDAFDAIYGTVEAVPEKRICAMEDGKRLRFGKRTLRFMHTLGHARHHICIYDSATRGIFAGDCFGLHYPSVQRGDKPYIMYSSTPTEFEPTEARVTIRRILAMRPERVYLTHYGVVEEVEAAGAVLKKSLNDLESIMDAGVRSELDGGELFDWLRERITEAAVKQFEDCGIVPTAADLALVDHDTWMNARGLAHNVERVRM